MFTNDHKKFILLSFTFHFYFIIRRLSVVKVHAFTLFHPQLRKSLPLSFPLLQGRSILRKHNENNDIHFSLRKRLYQRLQSSIIDNSNSYDWINRIERRNNDISIQEMFVEHLIHEPNDSHHDQNSDDKIYQRSTTKVIQIISAELEFHNKNHKNNCYSNYQTIKRMEGCLIHRDDELFNLNNDHHSFKTQHEGLIRFDFNFEDTKAFVNDETVDTFLTIVHRLYKHHLLWKANEDGNGDDKRLTCEYQFLIELQEDNDNTQFFNNDLLLSTNFFVPLNQNDVDRDGANNKSDKNRRRYKIDKLRFINHLNHYSFIHRGTEQGRIALELIGILSNERNSFNFDKVNSENSSNGRNVISYQKNIIPPHIIDEINRIMNIIKANGWLSTNPDSVDGLPSLHLNLITGGKPLFKVQNEDVKFLSKKDLSFESTISYLSTLLKPYLYGHLLPLVKDICDSDTVEISDVFLRNYGKNVQRDSYYEDEITKGTKDEPNTLNNSRFGLSPHYDVFSSATCVVALDSTASTGRNGLYTIYCQQDNGDVAVSNHAALKEFFPLQSGDAVVHSFDILHGVDVDSRINSSRTSLIIWFVDKYEMHRNDDEMMDDIKMKDGKGCNINEKPWLSQPLDHDHLKQFVLALASECHAECYDTDNEYSGFNENHELYIKSSMHGNAFALNSLAEICYDELLSDHQLSRAMRVLKQLNHDDTNPFLEKANCEVNQKDLAKALWFESSMRGNRVAQTSLADSLMEEYFISEQKVILDSNKKEDLLLVASTFFCMASQQGYEVATDALSRIIRLEYLRLTDQESNTIDEDIFMKQPVVLTACLS